MKRALLAVVCLLPGCATTSAVMLGTNTYAPTDYVEVLTEAPEKPFDKIAMLETRAPSGTAMTYLINSLKQKAANLGADAVVITEDASEHQPQGVMYNPWLGGYQTTGGGTLPIIRGLAIKYTGE